MYRTIMVPLDGSPFSEQALPLAHVIARQTGAALSLVHCRVAELEAPPETTQGEDDVYPAALAEAAMATGIEATAVVLEGEPKAELTDYVVRVGIELVCLATHGHGGLRRARLGSTADALIRQLKVPIVTMRPGEVEGGEGERGAIGLEESSPIEHILVPLDGSPLAEAVLGHLAAFDHDALRVSLVQAIPAPLPNDPASYSMILTVDQEGIEAETELALAYLDRVAERLVNHIGRVDTAILLEPKPLDAILGYADRHEVDLIAIATHGRGGLRRLALGSMADEILRTADVPVLVLRPGEP